MNYACSVCSGQLWSEILILCYKGRFSLFLILLDSIKSFDNQLSQRGSCPVSEESQRNRRRVTKMLVSVTVMFAVSWLPIQVSVTPGIVSGSLNHHWFQDTILKSFNIQYSHSSIGLNLMNIDSELFQSCRSSSYSRLSRCLMSPLQTSHFR